MISNDFGYEVNLVQNKALGAYLMYRTVKSYEKSEPSNSGCNLLYLFLVLPILYQKDIRDILKSTQIKSGIRMFADKFSSTTHKSSDIILRVHDLASLYKKLSWEAFTLATKSHLLAIIPEEDTVISRDTTIPAKYECPSIKPLLHGADRLGAWFAQNSLYEVALNLKVRF